MTEYLKYWIIAFFYYSTLWLLSIFFTDSGYLTEVVFNYFDAIHYRNIAIQGYSSHYEVAFFPLFPFIWKFSKLSVFGISALNSAAYISAIALFGKTEKLSTGKFLILLAVPSAVFYFIPYSEAFYFISAGIILYGMRKNNLYLQFIGIFLCCFCRPAIPVIFSSLALLHFFEKKPILITATRMSAAVAGTALAFTIHWIYTADFFSYFTSFNTWDYNFKFPLLPFKSGGGNLITQIDGYALLFGLAAIVTLFRIFKSAEFFKKVNGYEFFSLCYVSFFTLLILGLMRGGNLSSMNRFIFCSPFFIVAFLFMEKNIIPNKNLKSVLLLIIILMVFSLLFNSYVHIQSVIKYFAGALVLSFYFGSNHFKEINIKNVLLFIILTIIQLVFINRFLHGEWIG